MLDETNTQHSPVQKHSRQTNASKESATRKPKDQPRFKSVTETSKLENQQSLYRSSLERSMHAERWGSAASETSFTG